MSSGEVGGRTRSRRGLVWGGVVAAIFVAGVILGVSLSGGGGGHSQASVPSPASEAPVHASGPSPSAAAVAQALRHGVLNVVVDQPSSAEFTEQNRLIDEGAQVAVEELEGSGGLPGHIHVQLVQESLDGLSAAAVQERLRTDASEIVVLPCDTDSQLTLAAGAAHYGTLMLAPCNYEPAAAQRYPSYWSVGAAGNEEVAELARFMSTQGYLRAYVVSAPGSRYVETLTKDFEEVAKRKRIRIVGSASVAMGAQSFSSLAQTIKGIEPTPSVVFTALPPPVVNRLGSALQQDGVNATVFGTSVMDSRFTILSGANSLENAVFASYGFPREGTAAQHFANDYAKQFGKPPVGSLPGIGFETIRLLDAAAHQAHSAAPTAVEQALARGLTLPGVALADRRYLAGANHNPVAEVGVEKLVGNGFEPLLAGNPSGAPGA